MTQTAAERERLAALDMSILKRWPGRERELSQVDIYDGDILAFTAKGPKFVEGLGQYVRFEEWRFDLVDPLYIAIILVILLIFVP